MSSATPALGTNFLAVILYPPIQPLALARRASQALGGRCHEITARIRPIAGHCQTKFYAACSGAGMRSSSTVSRKSLPRSARLEVEDALYLFALTPFFGEDDDAIYRHLLAGNAASKQCE
jgi:hypothetical protein